MSLKEWETSCKADVLTKMALIKKRHPSNKLLSIMSHWHVYTAFAQVAESHLVYSEDSEYRSTDL